MSKQFATPRTIRSITSALSPSSLNSFTILGALAFLRSWAFTLETTVTFFVNRTGDSGCVDGFMKLPSFKTSKARHRAVCAYNFADVIGACRSTPMPQSRTRRNVQTAHTAPQCHSPRCALGENLRMTSDILRKNLRVSRFVSWRSRPG